MGMSAMKTRIGVVAPSCPIDESVAERVTARAEALYGTQVELAFHPQCFVEHGHFAGADCVREAAIVEVANDPHLDAVWFARGGYGSCRIAQGAIDRLTDVARGKAYLGYSDAGTLLGGLYGRGFGSVAHGPMPVDIRRAGGEAAVDRALRWLVERDPASCEPGLTSAPAAAFNMTILSMMIGTPIQPDLTGHILLLEEVGEHHYRIDRTLYHITSNPGIRAVAGIRFGRISDVIPNDRAFGQEAEEIAAHWCHASGIAHLGTADIGHDAENRVVPFG
jgi:muramoyltetrapeptide carboxypeptidase